MSWDGAGWSQRSFPTLMVLCVNDSTFLDSLIQCLTSFSMEKSFPITHLNCPWYCLRPLLHVLSLVTWEERQTSSLLQLPEDSVTVTSPEVTASHSISDASQDTTGLLGCLGMLLACVQLAVSQYLQILFCQAIFSTLSHTYASVWVVMTQEKHSTCALAECHTIGHCPWMLPAQIPLQSFLFLWQIGMPVQLGVICKFTEAALNSLIKILDEDIKQNLPQYWVLGTLLVTRFNSVHDIPLGLAIQPGFYLANNVSF